MIDYTNRDETSAHKSMAIGALTANVAAIVSVALIAERSPELKWAMVLFAISFPTLIFAATALERLVAFARGGGDIGSKVWLRRSVTLFLFVGLLSTAIGYLKFLEYYSHTAVVAFAVATAAGVTLSIMVRRSTGKK